MFSTFSLPSSPTLSMNHSCSAYKARGTAQSTDRAPVLPGFNRKPQHSDAIQTIVLPWYEEAELELRVFFRFLFYMQNSYIQTIVTSSLGLVSGRE